MGFVHRLLYVLFAAYALGLIVYVVLTWARRPGTEKFRCALEKLYLPFLAPLRVAIKPLRMGSAYVDVTPTILLVCILIVRAAVFYVLFGAPS